MKKDIYPIANGHMQQTNNKQHESATNVQSIVLQISIDNFSNAYLHLIIIA
jgi:hypothetical protein